MPVRLFVRLAQSVSVHNLSLSNSELELRELSESNLITDNSLSCFKSVMPCFSQVPVAGEDSEPDAEEAQHGQGGQEGDDQAGDRGALNIRHLVISSDQG